MAEGFSHPLATTGAEVVTGFVNGLVNGLVTEFVTGLVIGFVIGFVTEFVIRIVTGFVTSFGGFRMMSPPSFWVLVVLISVGDARGAFYFEPR